MVEAQLHGMPPSTFATLKCQRISPVRRRGSVCSIRSTQCATARAHAEVDPRPAKGDGKLLKCPSLRNCASAQQQHVSHNHRLVSASSKTVEKAQASASGMLRGRRRRASASTGTGASAACAMKCIGYCSVAAAAMQREARLLQIWTQSLAAACPLGAAGAAAVNSAA